MVIKTKAWVLCEGDESGNDSLADLREEVFEFEDITPREVLVEPLFGCWESNMDNALSRHPIDICKATNRKKVIIGNGGVVRVLKVGREVQKFIEGDVCVVFPMGVLKREHNFINRVYGYDEPQSIGLLAKQTKLHEDQLIKIPPHSRYSLKQWAKYFRFFSGWSNWKVASGTFRLMLDKGTYPNPYVVAWGGGVSLAQLELAQREGYKCAMIASSDYRLKLIKEKGIYPIDRRNFPDLKFDLEKYSNDQNFRRAYKRSELRFLEAVKEFTNKEKVSIFIDHIGRDVFDATLKVLATPSVLTSFGWRTGMDLSFSRAVECMRWHTFVHTHGSRFFEGLESMEYSEKNNWMPSDESLIYSWEDIPKLARDFHQGIDDYYPLYQVNN